MNTFDINGVQTEIIYEDRDVIAFVKPAGVLSQSSASCEASVLEYLDAYGNGAFTAHPIHRLDRNTAGVMICAKNKKAAAALSALIADGSMHKEYLAAVHGILEGTGTLEHDLYFDRRLDKSFPVKSSGRKGVKHAVLDYEAQHSFSEPERTVVRIVLHTGRTHQIRCQMAAEGHPLLGDGKYGGRGAKSVTSLYSCRITLDDEAISKTDLKVSPFRRALKEHPDLLSSTPEGFPWTE